MDFQTALTTWLSSAQAVLAEYHEKNGYKFAAPQLSIDPGGKKFIRIVRSSGPHDRSAFAFIEVATGNVLKPDGWKRPANGARGNIYTPEKTGVGPYGVHYAR